MLDLNNNVPHCDLEGATSIAALIMQVLNAISIFINLVHLVGIWKLQTLKSKPYWSLLVAMCCVDIWLSVCFTLAVYCKLRTYLNTVATFPTSWTLTVCILLDSGMLMRYLVIFLSAAERYLALCKPFVHQSNILVRHI